MTQPTNAELADMMEGVNETFVASQRLADDERLKGLLGLPDPEPWWAYEDAISISVGSL